MSTLNEEDEIADDSGWQRTVRRAAPHEPLSARRLTHSRESSAEKSQQGSLASPRIPASHSRGLGERGVDPKSATYGHHRQTSIVHGIQHSRNGSIASTTSSPLSPQLIAAAGQGFDRPDMHSVAARLEAEAGRSDSLVGPSGFPLERTVSAGDLALNGGTQRRLERRQSRPRRNHSQQHSHSKQQRDEQKTVGEYALHVLFTSVRIADSMQCTRLT